MINVSSQVMMYVCELARTGNFHKAARVCNTSQPNISMQIKKLEDQLAVKLFDRSNKHIQPTPKGRDIINLFTKILDQLNTLHTVKNKQFPESLILGIFPSIAPYLMPDIMRIKQTIFSGETLHILEDKTERIITELVNGRIDIIIAASPIKAENIIEIPLFEEDLYLAVSKKNKLAKLTEIQATQCRHEMILLLQEGHCLRDQMVTICKQHDLKIYQQLESASLETLKMLIKLNIGVSFIPEICKSNEADIAYIPLKNPKPKRKISLFTKKNYPYQELLSIFKETLNR